jgi:hypothetical protein
MQGYAAGRGVCGFAGMWWYGDSMGIAALHPSYGELRGGQVARRRMAWSEAIPIVFQART